MSGCGGQGSAFKDPKGLKQLTVLGRLSSPGHETDGRLKQSMPLFLWKKPVYLSWSSSLRVGFALTIHLEATEEQAGNTGQELVSLLTPMACSSPVTPRKELYAHLEPQFMQFSKMKRAVEIFSCQLYI